MAKSPNQLEHNEEEGTSIAEVAYQLMQFVIGVERRNRLNELRNRQEVLSLYALCHRAARGEVPVPKARQAGAKGAAASKWPRPGGAAQQANAAKVAGADRPARPVRSAAAEIVAASGDRRPHDGAAAKPPALSQPDAATAS